MRKRILDLVRMTFFRLLTEKRIIKLVLGKPYGSGLTKLVPNHEQFKKPTLRLAERKGVKYELDLSDLVDWFIHFGFVDSSKEHLLNLISKNDVLLDVGTNIGEISLRSSIKVGEHGRVHAFEPDKSNFIRLSKNFNLNNFQNLILNNLAIGSTKGKVNLENNDQNNKGTTRIVLNSLNVQDIPQTTIDNFVEENDLQKIDVIKIDVEGYENEVLVGAAKTILRFKPLLFIELDDSNLRLFNSSAIDLLNKLSEFSYRILDARTQAEISTEMNFSNCHFDVLATPISNKIHST